MLRRARHTKFQLQVSGLSTQLIPPNTDPPSKVRRKVTLKIENRLQMRSAYFIPIFTLIASRMLTQCPYP